MNGTEAAELLDEALAVVDDLAGRGDVHVAVTTIRAILKALKGYANGEKTAAEVRAEWTDMPRVLSSHDATADAKLREKFNREGKP